MEPLGQSQVLAYLRGLSCDYSIALITFEKPEDLADTAGMDRLREECLRLGIQWTSLRFRWKPKLIAPALDMLRFAWLGLREVHSGACLIHARSYIPAAVALVLHRLTGVPFIFDMRALWPEELITAGRLRRGSSIHRAIRWIERACLAKGTVVSLTHAAGDYLREKYQKELYGKTIHVIPTCVDLDRFVPGPSAFGTSLYGCNGTVLSGWFRFHWLAAFYAKVATCEPKARFEVVTRDDQEEVEAQMIAAGVPRDRLVVYCAPSSRMPEIVQRQTVSVMFYAGGAISELGRSPTRMAEVLACGRPLVTNAGVGDVVRIVERYRVGVLVQDNSGPAMTEALNSLYELLSDSGLADRCRQAAEEIFSLRAGTEGYRRIYESLIASSVNAR